MWTVHMWNPEGRRTPLSRNVSWPKGNGRRENGNPDAHLRINKPIRKRRRFSGCMCIRTHDEERSRRAFYVSNGRNIPCVCTYAKTRIDPGRADVMHEQCYFARRYFYIFHKTFIFLFFFFMKRNKNNVRRKLLIAHDAAAASVINTNATGWNVYT